MRTSSAWRLNRFQPAASRARSRAAAVVSRIGSTAWIRNGSMIVCQRSTSARIRRGCAAGRARGTHGERLDSAAMDRREALARAALVAAGALTVGILALALRLLAVNVLPIDY